MKKIAALLLTLCLALAAGAAPALELLPAGDMYPINYDKPITWYVEEPVNLHEKFKDATESPFYTGLAKHFGVNVTFQFPTTGSTPSTYTQTLLADPASLPNIMQSYFMNNATQYLDDEIIWDLTPYIQEYAPAYYAFLQTNPAYDRAMKTDDGRYYAFGFFREDGGWNDSYQGPVVRKDWLDECGLKVPETISEFEQVIRVFKEKYGATFNTAFNVRWKQMGLAGAFGAYGNADTTAGWGWYVKDGKVGLGMAQPEWRNYLSWLNKLWKDGLIDQDVMTEDDTTIKAKVHTDKCGISVSSMGQINNWNKERVADGKEPVWIGIPYPKADDGSISCVFGGMGIGNHTAVITKTANEDMLKACLKMLNFAYTKEGFLYWNYGNEGVSWEYGENGLPKFTKLVTEDKDTDPITKYNGATWGGCFIQATNLLHLKNSPVSIAANDAWFYVYGKEAVQADAALKQKNTNVTGGWKWPNGITFTTAESDELDMIAQNIPIYVTESYAAFLTGGKDINDDAVWEDYLKGFETYKLSRVLELRQAAYDRYVAR